MLLFVAGLLEGGLGLSLGVSHLLLNDFLAEELGHSWWNVIWVLDTLLCGDLLVHQIALKNGVGRDIEDGDEGRSDHPGEQEADEEREEG